MKHNRRNELGFTLIELLVVIVIIGILAAIALPNFIKARNKAREAEVKSNIHAIQIALERYAVDSGGVYPTFLVGAERDFNIIKASINLGGNGVSQFPTAGQTPFCKTATPADETGPEGIRIQMDPLIQFGYLSESGLIDLADLGRKIDTGTAAVIMQSPNFFGGVENVKAAAEVAHRAGALLIDVFSEAVALGLLSPPVDADIVAGELQSFAMSPSFGGPFAGVIATRDKYIRQLPGRLVGETKDSRGNRAFCLTLATREQHIRREKATSNICTNQALIALMATVFMTVYGKAGLRELAAQNLAKAHYLAGKLPLRFSGPFFNEFVASTNGRSAEAINGELLEKKIVGGLPLGRFYPELDGCILLCATEMSSRESMDAVAEAFGGNAEPEPETAGAHMGELK